MKYKKFYLYYFLILLCVNQIFSADFDVDFATFRSADETDVVEIYLLIPRNIFKFAPSDNKYKSNVLVRVALAQNDTVVVMDEWTFVDVLSDTSEDISRQRIPEITSLQAQTGEYDLIVFIADLVSGKQFKKEKHIILTKYSDSELQLSDIHTASQLKKTQKENKFSKYFGYDMIPIASSIFSVQNPMVYAFCEVYNLKYDENSPGTYNVHYSITDLNGNEVKALEWITRRKPGDSSVEVNGINIVSLSSGLYNLKIEVIDNETGKNASATKRFYVLKESNVTKLAQLMETAYLSEMTEKELDEKWGPMRYIATEMEKKRYKKSDIGGKRQIIAHFWDKRDSDFTTEINETKTEFEQKLAYANENLKTAQTKGWATDMGRVLIIYGFPSEIERFPSSIEKKPYQIWHYYEIEGGVEFVFIDKTGFGMMELVHSTARNELQDYNWQRWIMPASSQQQVPY